MIQRKKRDRWIRWLRVIREDLSGLIAWRDAYRRAIALLATLDEGTEASALLRETCTQAMAMGVRRQLKRGSRNITLAGLLEDILAHPAEAPAEDVVSRDRVSRDLAALQQVVRPVEHFADRAVAHADRRGGEAPAMEQVEAALLVLVRLHDFCARQLGEPELGRI